MVMVVKCQFSCIHDIVYGLLLYQFVVCSADTKPNRVFGKKTHSTSNSISLMCMILHYAMLWSQSNVNTVKQRYSTPSFSEPNVNFLSNHSFGLPSHCFTDFHLNSSDVISLKISVT